MAIFILLFFFLAEYIVMIKNPKKPYCSGCNGYVLSCYQFDPDRFSIKFLLYLDMKIA